VNIYDFIGLGRGVAVPYGAYDLGRNEGFVNVGISHDTAEFAVESLRRWWRGAGRQEYPDARRLLLCADSGGSNRNRLRAWKYHLRELAAESGLEITVCHYPPDTSKWNKVEHRLFSFISINRAGEPLVDYQTVVSLIGATRTQSGLRVRAKLDRHRYSSGERITQEEMELVNLHRHRTFPAWNYTILSKPKTSQTH
jgi:Rhodopirellula transposase DDE domain